MVLRRAPMPALRPFVQELWAGEGSSGGEAFSGGREHMLPTGLMHLVVRLSDSPLRILNSSAESDAQLLRHAMFGGARSSFYIREQAGPSASVGAVLRPGAAPLLFGVGADELAERHTPLEDLLGAEAAGLTTQLGEAPNAQRRVQIMEAFLCARLPVCRGLHPAVAQLLRCVHELPSVQAAVDSCGLSHRQFIANFRRAVGLAPKNYLRVRRFQLALHTLHRGHTGSWAELALTAGYSDQSHFNREFLAFTGVTPGDYRRLAPRDPNHLRVASMADVGQISSIPG